MKAQKKLIARCLLSISCIPFCASAQELTNPWGPTGTAEPAWSSNFVLASIDITTPSVTNIGTWNLNATGRTQLGARALGLTILDIGTRAQTRLETDALAFGINSRANVGTLNLNNLLGAGVAMNWSGSFTDSSYAWTQNPTTTYNYSASVTTSDAVLRDLSALGTTISLNITDGAGNTLKSLNGLTLLNALGVQVLGDQIIGLNANDTYLLETLIETPNEVTQGLTITYSATSLVNTSLLELGDTIFRVSDFSLTPTAVPEPKILFFALTSVLTLFHRNRKTP